MFYSSYKPKIVKHVMDCDVFRLRNVLAMLHRRLWILVWR